MVSTDCMCQENKEVENSRGFKIASMYRYKNLITLRNAREDWLQTPETILTTQASAKQNNQRIKMGRKTNGWTFQATNKQSLTRKKLGHGSEKEALREKLWPNEQSIRQWPGKPEFNPRLSHTKDLIPPCLTLNHYKVSIKGKMEQCRD